MAVAVGSLAPTAAAIGLASGVLERTRRDRRRSWRRRCPARLRRVRPGSSPTPLTDHVVEPLRALFVRPENIPDVFERCAVGGRGRGEVAAHGQRAFLGSTSTISRARASRPSSCKKLAATASGAPGPRRSRRWRAPDCALAPLDLAVRQRRRAASLAASTHPPSAMATPSAHAVAMLARKPRRSPPKPPPMLSWVGAVAPSRFC